MADDFDSIKNEAIIIDKSLLFPKYMDIKATSLDFVDILGTERKRERNMKIRIFDYKLLTGDQSKDISNMYPGRVGCKSEMVLD